MPGPTITGYYRYTDIWFEWHKVLPNQDDRFPLKAILSPDALADTDHPLRRPGEKGITLYMGTLASGEARLMFSSAQADYVRYWLHAMKLTASTIPMPYSDCLMLKSAFRTVSPVTFEAAESLKKAIKTIDKNNKRLKGSNPLLKARRDAFERVRTMWDERIGVWCAIDFEAWDRDHTLLTEFGWSLVCWENGEEVDERGHLIVKERRGYQNTYVHQWRDHYQYGTSEDVDKTTLRSRIHELIFRNTKRGPLFLVFHDCGGDIKYLGSSAIQAPIENLVHTIPETTPKEGIFVVDTTDLYAVLKGEDGGNKRSLQNICSQLGVPHAFLHNAGNDAHCTLKSLKAMAAGGPLDMQREKRWPPQPAREAVNAEEEEDGGLSDLEGLMPPMEGTFEILDA